MASLQLPRVQALPTMQAGFAQGKLIEGLGVRLLLPLVGSHLARYTIYICLSCCLLTEFALLLGAV